MNISLRPLQSALGIFAVVVAGPLISRANAQGTPADAASVKLTTATTDDRTASAGVPDGWKFVRGSNGYMYITGPNGERLNLGVIIVAKNGPTAPGTPSGDVAFALPFSTSMKEKLTTILEAGAAKQGLPKPTVVYASEARTKLPMCSRMLGTSTSGADAKKFEAIMCSLQPDWLGFYKNILFLLQVPASHAVASRPIIEKVASTFRITPVMFKKMLAPYTDLPPMPPQGAPRPAMLSGLAPYQDPTNSDCFDYNVIRESPPWEVPMRCGGINPY